MDNRCSRIPKWTMFTTHQLVNIARYYLSEKTLEHRAVEILKLIGYQWMLDIIGTPEFIPYIESYFVEKNNGCDCDRPTLIRCVDACYVWAIGRLIKQYHLPINERTLPCARFVFITCDTRHMINTDTKTLFLVGRELEGHPDPNDHMKRAIDFYLDNLHLVRRSALYTVMSLRAIGICRDVARLIGRAVFKENFLLISEGRFCFAK